MVLNIQTLSTDFLVQCKNSRVMEQNMTSGEISENDRKFHKINTEQLSEERASIQKIQVN